MNGSASRRPTGIDRRPGSLGGEGRFGVVIRPPVYRLRDGTFVCSRLLGVDRNSVAALPGRIEVVIEGNFVGVVATSLQAAREAARRLHLEWQPLTATGDSPPRGRALEAESSRHSGNTVETAAPQGRYLTRHYGWPSRMRWGDEPGWVVADHAHDRLDVWGPTATPTLLKRDLMALTGLPQETIDLHCTAQASGIGRHCGDDAAADATLMSRAVGRPVAVWLDASYVRDVESLGQAQRIAVSAELNAQGAIERYRNRQELAGSDTPVVALWLSGVLDTQRHDDGATSEPVSPPFSPYTFRDQRLAAPGVSREVHGDDGVLELQHGFARESFLDEVARTSGQDPVALRLRHLDDRRGVELIESVTRRAGWVWPTKANEEGLSADVNRGRGFAYAQLPDRHGRIDEGVRSAWIADIEVNRITGDVSLTRLVVGQDSGPLVDTAQLQEILQQRVLGVARPLLAREPSFDEWGENGGGESQSKLTAETRDVARAPCSTPMKGSDGEQVSALSPLDEADLSPGVAVIANALFDATGVRFRQPPFTAPRVRQALQGECGTSGSEATAGRRLSRWRWRWLAGAAVATAGAAAMLWPWKSPIAPVARPAANLYSAETIERGRLVAEAGDCAVCHTGQGGIDNAGGRAFDTPFGTLYSTNITPDEATGIGNWSYAAFERAMRHGISRDGRHLYPAFPYTAFAKTSDADMQALYAYLMAQPAVSAEPPANELSFPFNMRALMAGWNALYHDAAPFRPDPSRSDLYNRGAYLAEGLGHCSACHSPRNVLGAEQGGERYLAGALVEGWEAPPLNALSRSPIPWSEEALYRYLRGGESELHGVASGPMAPVVAGLGELPESDVRAIAHYVAAQMDASVNDTDDARSQAQQLVARSAASTSGMEAGERLFDGACASCHVDTGLPSFTQAKVSLALNTNLYSERPDNVIQSILGGVHATNVSGIGEMPGFADSFSDSQVTTLVEYLRARFAPGEPAWSGVAERVSQIRKDDNKTHG
ncbi:cytochrome [Litchfieldella qijiaojingensis]|uniref:Cytochrome n=1 Tax=Litchfieldella qijiaojingensis TaxID=980347 RepID=A0ABQ2ZCU5_9GAMM|nr:c-type cytochrome [Halomonas qijiaojingensis]GGY09155.1 cytochrome [Halomonas qijiaojingensis]